MVNTDRPRYDVTLIRHDAASLGWDDSRLAAKSRKNVATISLFLSEKRQTPKTALAIAKALGQPVSRYIVPLDSHQARSARRVSVGAA